MNFGTDEYSPGVREALRQGATTGRRKGGPTSSRDTGASFIAPISIFPMSQNPLMGGDGEADDEEWVCFDGEERDAELYEHTCNDTTDCVYCKHGDGSGEASGELEAIHNLEEEHSGTMADPAMWEMISTTYKKRIHDPAALQQQVRNKRLKKNDDAPVPEWAPTTVARHFTKDGLYPLREIGDDIRFARTMQQHLRFKGIMKSKGGEKMMDLERAKLWKELSRHKTDLLKTLVQFNPNALKKKGQTSVGVKPPGAK